MVSLRSEKHEIFTLLEQNKKSLSPYDNKRYVLGDGYSTRAHGHWGNQVPREESREDIEEPSPF